MDRMFARSPAQHPASKGSAALVSVLVNIVLIGGKLLVGLLTGSLAVLAGITVVAVFGWQTADPLAGIAVAIIIGSTALRQGRRTAQVLLDAMPDARTLRAIERILETDPSIHGYHALRARQAGKHVLLDVSVHVEGALSLSQAHDVGHAVSERIRRELPAVSDAVVHVEPAEDEHG